VTHSKNFTVALLCRNGGRGPSMLDDRRMEHRRPLASKASSNASLDLRHHHHHHHHHQTQTQTQTQTHTNRTSHKQNTHA
jgi:hypothetical protein